MTTQLKLISHGNATVNLMTKIMSSKSSQSRSQGESVAVKKGWLNTALVGRVGWTFSPLSFFYFPNTFPVRALQAKKKRLKGKGHRKAYAASGTAHGHQAYGKSKAEASKDRLG